MSAATIRRFPDLDALSRAAAEEVAEILRTAVAARGAASVALAGGTTPRRLYQALASMGPAALPWSQIDLWWGDERAVAPDHPDANYRMVREALLDPLGAQGPSGPRIHRMRGEWPDLDAAARAYEGTLREAFGEAPTFDLVLLGMGADGHTASLFPGSPALTETRRWVVANPVESPLTHGAAVRLTLTAPALSAARNVRFVVAGADKAPTLAAVLEGPRGRFPAQLVVPAAPAALAWLIDEAAGAALGQLGGVS